MPAESLATTQEIITPPTIEENFSAWNDRLNRLEAEINSDGLKKMPDWWFDGQNKRILVDQIKTGENDPVIVSHYLGLNCRERELSEMIFGYKNNEGFFYQTVHNLGVDVVGEAFSKEEETGSLHQAMLASLGEIASNNGYASSELEVLKKAYGLDKLTGLLGQKNSDYNKDLRQALLNKSVLKTMFFAEKQKNENNAQSVTRGWCSEAIEEATGVSRKEAMDYAFSISRSLSEEKVADVIDRFDHLGVEKIRKITDFTGIIGLENYSIEQLDRMYELATDPDGMAEKLKNHDVDLIMINRAGDHNSVMSRMATDFDTDGAERTLFFEIASASDILKDLSKLAKCGIKPSTVVIGAHGQQGQLSISDERMRNLPRKDVLAIAGRKLVAMANGTFDINSGIKVHSMNDMRGVARAVEHYMQPSRAIDDGDEDMGRKKIIFQTCHSGAETGQLELDGNGDAEQIGVESIVSQLAKDLAASGATSNVDIYGAPDGIQMHKTEKGVRYSGQPVEGSDGRIALDAIRIRLENGKVTKGTVDEIILHR